ncbi:transcriptional regulator [Dissulfurirhabdus thermomarina]|uniref:Transcriptional regulator n=1 Tax=Dissulfurirhabdus thermomarina TaxID=1765737 RepID=A0A6N9TNA0_DISTH|nr:transcriptional regulator [Dissulfurirhabdus thermomarina]NDY41264.1 transcriptional regulator [Dissulfurirhabdus thermomarina]
MNVEVASLVEAKRRAESGVDYSPRTGARCPWCGGRARIYRTLPWDGAARVRYHLCRSTACPLAALRVTIKSVEVDP